MDLRSRHATRLDISGLLRYLPLFFPLLLRYLPCSYPLIVPLTAVSEGARPDRTDVLDTGHIFHHTARITIIADQDIAIIGTTYVHSKARPFFPPYLDVY